MLEPESWAEIRRLHIQEHIGIRQIARRLGVDRKTVKRALKHTRYPGLGPKPKAAPRRSILDPHKPLIQLYLSEAPDLTAVQIWERLQRENKYPGEISVVRRFVKTLRKAELEAFLRLTHLPGKVAQVDWAHCGFIRIGNCIRRLSLFVMVLAYSRALYAEFTLSEKLDAFLEAHERAFRFFKGVVERVLYDNCKTAVLDRRAGQIRFNPRLLDYSAHRLFKPRACPPRRPWHKGIVENSIRYARRNFLNGRPPAQDFAQEARDLEVWLRDTANVRLHAETKRRPCDLLAEVEQAALIPLQAAPYDAAFLQAVAANAFFEVHFDGNRYSVPHTYAHRSDLLLKATGAEVVVVDGPTEIARHARSYERGRRIRNPEHERGLLARKRRAESDTLLARLRDLLGERADTYAAGLVRKEIRSEKHLRQILALADRYGSTEVREALEHGLVHEAFGADYVENIVHQRRRARHAPVLAPLCAAAELAAIHVPEPDLTPYQTLLFGEGERTSHVESVHEQAGGLLTEGSIEGSAQASAGESPIAQSDPRLGVLLGSPGAGGEE